LTSGITLVYLYKCFKVLRVLTKVAKVETYICILENELQIQQILKYSRTFTTIS